MGNYRNCDPSRSHPSYRQTKASLSRDSSLKPPRNDPLYVPPDVGQLIHQTSQRHLVNAVRLAEYLTSQMGGVPLKGERSLVAAATK